MHSLVSSEDVAAHLRLLGAIQAFLISLSKGHFLTIGGEFRPTFDGELFFHRSVLRFKSWIQNILRPKFISIGSDQGLQECELPPFDVVVLLHSYMLHPRSFYEDTIRVYPELAVLKGFPLLQVAAHINEAMDYVVNVDHINFWEISTGEKFDPPLVTSASDMLNITCPSCNHSFAASWLTIGSDTGTHISIPCNLCRLQITNQVVSVAHFMDDIRRSSAGDNVGVAGTLLTAAGILDFGRSRELTSKIAAAADFQVISELQLHDAVEHLRTHPRPTDIEIEFLSCYGNPGKFSIDLKTSVLRQARFAFIMHDAGWTNPIFPIEAATTISESIKRYGGFLELIMKGRTMGPTNEIDLVWHTHQLSANYRNDLVRLFGWFLDHVDMAASETLELAHSTAGKYWEETFGTPYEGYFQKWY